MGKRKKEKARVNNLMYALSHLFTKRKWKIKIQIKEFISDVNKDFVDG